MAFYIITFIIGLLLDFANKKGKNVKQWRKIYLVWFFVFSCFGYMTGSDWRGYEMDFYEQASNNTLYKTEYGFALIFKIFYYLTHDYWVTVSVLKCFYLYTLIRWLRKLTPFWMSIIAISIINTDTFGLGFILIDNPLRYMVASTFINIAMEMILIKKNVPALVLMLLAVTFHNTSIFYLVLLIPIISLSDKIYKVNRILLVALYIMVIVFVSAVENLAWLKDGIILAIRMRVGGIDNYSFYDIEDTSTLFSIGSMIKYVLFAGVLYSREYMLKMFDKGRLLYGITVLFYFFDRILVAIPTGSRLLLFFNFFTVLYFVLLLSRKQMLGYLYISLMLVIGVRNIWSTYQYIPYSNSIFYILTEHKPYHERSNYNVKAMIERTGNHPNN